MLEGLPERFALMLMSGKKNNTGKFNKNEVERRHQYQIQNKDIIKIVLSYQCKKRSHYVS